MTQYLMYMSWEVLITLVGGFDLHRMSAGRTTLALRHVSFLTARSRR